MEFVYATTHRDGWLFEERGFWRLDVAHWIRACRRNGHQVKRTALHSFRVQTREDRPVVQVISLVNDSHDFESHRARSVAEQFAAITPESGSSAPAKASAITPGKDSP